MVAANSVDGGHFLELILESNWKIIESSFVNMTTRIIFEVNILFYCLLAFNDKLLKKTLMVPQNTAQVF